MTNAGEESEIFSRSPFSLTASPDTAGCWAGQKSVLERMNRLQRSFAHRADSSLDIVWANLGAGKSHALYHLAYLLCQSQSKQKSVSIFVEMPEQVRKFINLYQRIATELPTDLLAKNLANMAGGPDDLKQAGLVLLRGGPTEKSIVREWITGGRPHLTDLRRCSGIRRRIEDDMMATDMLCGIIGALAARRIRLVILLDEFQRIGVLRQGAREAVLSSIRSLFSRSPAYFSMVLAIGMRVEKGAMNLLPPELRTLLGKRPTMSLPEMNQDEAYDFVIERFRWFRPAVYQNNDTAPFTADAIRKIISYLEQQAKVPLIPREILQALAWVYDEAMVCGSELIDSGTALGFLDEMRWEE